MTLFREIDNSLTQQITTPFDILVRNFFDIEDPFNPLHSAKMKHPVDVYEDKEGLTLEIACTGLGKEEVDIKIERDVLRIIYNKPKEQSKSITKDNTKKYYYNGLTKRAFSFGYKVATRFNLTEAEAEMENGLLIVKVPHLVTTSTTKSITIK
jgi:HSP20 family molecular chaperone IbpA|tara:strand:- start:1287 stop:1745 length:459 start_codon:yes stop_codon:yes gene_type:complete